MAKQYQEIKSRHKDSILFFRLGDFYEMFNDDAAIASKELEITLTGRGEGKNRMPMCGIPYHAADSYIARLIGRGHKVAICEQVEDPKLSESKIVKREVIRIVTPGTVSDPAMLPEKTSNYLLAVSFSGKAAGLAVVDACTGEFRVTEIGGRDFLQALLNEIERVAPSECLIPDIQAEGGSRITDFLKLRGIPSSIYKDVYDSDVASGKLREHFGTSTLEGFGISTSPAALGAAAAVLDYLRDTQRTSLAHITSVKRYSLESFMYLDAVTRRNLEITQTIRDKSVRGSLLWVLDRSVTSMGARMLKRWVLEPLLDVGLINARLDAVEELSGSSILRDRLKAALKGLSDIERIAGKANAGARDLVALKEALDRLPGLREILNDSTSPTLKEICSLDGLSDLAEEIGRAIVPDPPAGISDGGMIRDGFNRDLDELRKMTRGGRQWITEMESAERARTGIKSLKVGFNRVFGYYIEVTRSNLSQVPPEYIRKQTLVNSERFITPELKDRESMILNAEASISELELSILRDVRSRVASRIRELQAIASALARLDALLSLAQVSVENNYRRPRVLEGRKRIKVRGGRHPVVEKTIGEYRFVPNDVEIGEKASFLLITGPNMAGKSTYMRQTALITLLAQIGSFVPAESAELSLVDRVFTRIGAMDDIFSGQSTFMLEMTETANILHNATESSLIILDEIGRGTSTFDGMSIAAAVAEYIHDRISAPTMFATHYHEITRLAEGRPGIANLNVLVKEEGDHITFLHKIAPGPADRSYGIQVAKLAGLPGEVIGRAKEVYNALEMVEKNIFNRGDG